MGCLSVSEVAREIQRRSGQVVPPPAITNLFYKRILDDERCPIVGRVRMIPEDYVDEIQRTLEARGIISSEVKPCAG